MGGKEVEYLVVISSSRLLSQFMNNASSSLGVLISA